MKQEQINSLIRTVLSLIGGLLLGGGAHFFFGHVIDTAYWEEISGTVVTLVSIYWSVKSKEVDIEKLQGAVRQVITFICGILAARNLITSQQALAIIAFAGAIIPFIQAGLARKKSEQLAEGKIHVAELKK